MRRANIESILSVGLLRRPSAIVSLGLLLLWRLMLMVSQRLLCAVMLIVVVVSMLVVTASALSSLPPPVTGPNVNMAMIPSPKGFTGDVSGKFSLPTVDINNQA